MNSPKTVTMVIGGLIAIVLLCVAGSLVLAAMENEEPAGLLVIAASAGGALAGILARTQSAAFEDEPIAVIVRTRLAAVDKESAGPTPVPSSAFSPAVANAANEDDDDTVNPFAGRRS